jgi:methyl-accepting chemotaxis protein PixJ
MKRSFKATPQRDARKIASPENWTEHLPENSSGNSAEASADTANEEGPVLSSSRAGAWRATDVSELSGSKRPFGLGQLFSPGSDLESDLGSDLGLRKSLGLSRKAATWVVLLSVLPVLLGGGLAYRAANRLLLQNVAAEKVAEADEVAVEISRFLARAVVDVKALADPISSAGLLSENADNNADSGTTQPGPSIESLLSDLQAEAGEEPVSYSLIAVYSSQGQLLAQANAPQDGLSVAGDAAGDAVLNWTEEDSTQVRGQAYFKQVMRSQQLTVSEPTLGESAQGESAQGQVIWVAQVILDSAGNSAGAVVAELPVERIQQTLLSPHQDVAPEGTHAEEARAESKDTTYWLTDSFGQPFYASTAAEKATAKTFEPRSPFFQAANQQRAAQGWQDDGDHIYAYAPIGGESLPLNWSLVSLTQPPFVWQPSLLRQMALATGGTSLLAGLLGLTIAQRMARMAGRSRRWSAQSGQLNGQLNDQLNDQLNGQLNGQAQGDRRLPSLFNEQMMQSLLEGDAQKVASAIAPLIAEALDMDRVSIWKYASNGPKSYLNQPLDQSLETVSDPLANTLADDEILCLLAQVDLVLTEEAVGLSPPGSQEPQPLPSCLRVTIKSGDQTLGLIQGESISAQAWQASEEAYLQDAAYLMAIAIRKEQHTNLATDSVTSDGSDGSDVTEANRQMWDIAYQVLVQAEAQSALVQAFCKQSEQLPPGIDQLQQASKAAEQSTQGLSQQLDSTQQSLQQAQQMVASGQAVAIATNQSMRLMHPAADHIIQQVKVLDEFVGIADQFIQEQSELAALTQNLAINASLSAARAAEQQSPQQFTVTARQFNSIANQINQLAQQTSEGLVSLKRRAHQTHGVIATTGKEAQAINTLINSLNQQVLQSSQVFENLQTTVAQALSAGNQASSSRQEIAQSARSLAALTAELLASGNQTAEEAFALRQRAQMRAEQIEALSAKLLSSAHLLQPAQEDSLQPTADKRL